MPKLLDFAFQRIKGLSLQAVQHCVERIVRSLKSANNAACCAALHSKDTIMRGNVAVAIRLCNTDGH